MAIRFNPVATHASAAKHASHEPAMPLPAPLPAPGIVPPKPLVTKEKPSFDKRAYMRRYMKTYKPDKLREYMKTYMKARRDKLKALKKQDISHGQ